MQPRPFPEPKSRGKFQPFVPSELKRLYDTVTSRANISAAPGQGAGAHVDGTGPHFYSAGDMAGGFWAKVVADVSASPSDPATQRVYTWTSAIHDQDGDFAAGGLEAPDGQQVPAANLPYLPAYEVNNQTVAPGTVVRMFWGWGPWLYFANPLTGGTSETIIENLYVTNEFVTNITVDMLVIVEVSITVGISVNVNVFGASKLLLTAHSGGSTITNLTGGVAGQVLYVENVGADKLVLSAAGNVLTPLGFDYTLWPRDGSIIQFDGAVWRFDTPTFGAANVDATQLTYSCDLLKANNDLGVLGSNFGRLEAKDNADGTNTWNWQGIKGSVDGAVFVGPQRDLWIQKGACNTISVSVSSDAGTKSLKYTIDTVGESKTITFPSSVATLSFNSGTCVLTYTTNPAKTLTFTCGVLTGDT